jgi:hypothetical protein
VDRLEEAILSGDTRRALKLVAVIRNAAMRRRTKEPEPQARSTVASLQAGPVAEMADELGSPAAGRGA